MLTNNVILNSDSYKYSQWNQYPEGTEHVYSYIESRGGLYNKVVYNGLQPFLHYLAENPITFEMIDEAEKIILAHGLPFNREGWEYIVEQHKGKLPVLIKGIDEGTVLPHSNVLVTIVNTDPSCWWLTSFLETALLRAIWYPTTVASNSYHSKEIILEALKRTGDPSLIDFKLHDFGARGVSSLESAGIGGAAHLINFLGTDTVEALGHIIRHYGTEDVKGFSIPAMEHSTVTSWGREGEEASFRNMLTKHGKPGGLIACVSDSYDIYAACKLWGTKLKDDVIKSGATVVVRPDSGDPAVVVTKCAQILDQYFGSTVNDKGFKVLNNVRIIQGDGIDHTSIRSILFSLTIAGYSADNIAFGQGGALLQQVNRDTLKFAMKCSAARIMGEWVDVYKDPVTDAGKKSKRGVLGLYKTKDGNNIFRTVRKIDMNKDQEDLLKIRFLSGELVNETTFDEIRARAKIS
jgi:nicotinamide phosphoribosyltransferase